MADTGTVTTGETPRRGRSAWAIVAGFLCVVLLSLGTDEILHLLKIYPPWEQVMSDSLFALATAYRAVYNVVGCYLTARLAPNRPMRHALLLGWVGTLVALLGAVATWNHQPPLGPHWYSLVLVVIALPCAWLGGKLYEQRAQERATA
jgi:drug/metabolite transporter (DMT)-like permease